LSFSQNNFYQYFVFLSTCTGAEGEAIGRAEGLAEVARLKNELKVMAKRLSENNQ